MDPSYWLELTSTYRETIVTRIALYEKNGPLVLQSLPGSELACRELMQTALQWLTWRYPAFFSLTPPGGSYTATSTSGHSKTVTNDSATHHTFHNALLGTTILLTTSTSPLLTLLHTIPEDFGLMLRNPATGIYHLRAGVICSALGWSLASKISLPLASIHEPVPDYLSKMAFSMDRYFSRMPCESPIQRGSWGLECDTPLFMPPGDPHEKLRDVQLPPEELPISRVHLRVDWQTLRRLPMSGCVVFNFKALFTPVESFREEAYVPALCLKVLKEGKENIMRYKNAWHVQHVAVPALEEWKREQEERGMVEKGWEEHTLEEAPFFPGWEG